MSTKDPTGRILPHNLDAEAAVLSACLISPDRFGMISDLLKGSHFFSEANRMIFNAIAWLMKEGTEVDLVSVKHQLAGSGRLDRCGGSAYLAQIHDATPAVANIVEHAQIVFDAWRLRRVVAVCQRIAAEGYDYPEVAPFLDEAQAAVFAAGDQPDASPVVPMRISRGPLAP